MAVERLVGTLVLRLTGVFCAAVAVVAVVHPRQPTIPYDRFRLLVCLAGVTVLLVAATRLLRGRVPLDRPAAARLVAPVLTVVGSVVCTVLALALRYDFGWDARVVAAMSRQLALGQQLNSYQVGYLSRYPNNLPLLAIDNLCQALGRAWGLDYVSVFILLNGLCLAVTLQSTYWLVSMLRSPRAGVTAQLLVLGLVGLSPWMTVAYTDTVAMPFVVASTALVVAAARSGSRWVRVAFVVLAVLALLVGYEIKTTPVVSIVAVGCIAALVLTSRPAAARRLVALGLVAGLALFFVGTVVAKHEAPALARVSASSIDRSQSPPAVWWVYMGTTEHPVNGQPRYGAYDGEIVGATRSLDGKAAGRYAAAQLRTHLSDLGVGGYLEFAGNKAAWNWGDGMFWAWSEGIDGAEADLTHGRLAAFVDTWNHPHGPGYAWRAALTQAVWLVLLLTVAARLLRARWRWELGLLALSVLGIAAFTVVFQGRSRYLLVYVPIVVSLACVLPAVLTPRTRHRTSLRRSDDHRGADREVVAT